MSIRDFTPRANRRRGQSQRSKIFLIAIVGAAILLQIPYPLLDGRPLEILTLLTVYCGAAAMFVHAWMSFGSKFALTYIAITTVFALVIETIGVNTGWPFGVYEYSSTLGFLIVDVPLVVPFAWAMMAYPALIAARRVAGAWVFLYGGAILMGWDLFLDPQMVTAGRWTWVVADIFLGWSLIGGFISQFFFFDRPGLALFAGAIYGAILAPYFFNRWLNRA